MGNLTDTEYCRLVGSSSADSWARTCRRIKKAHGGQYPADWYDMIIKPDILGVLGLPSKITVKNSCNTLQPDP